MDIMEMASAVGVRGFLHCNEVQRLAELAIGRDVCEIGAFCGLSAWAMSITAKSVLSIDTFAADTAGQRQTSGLTTLDAYLAAVANRRNVDYRVAKSEDAIHLWGGDFDLIFIDAMHTYEDVRDDIERWWPRLRPGGIMAFHDYGHDAFPGVKRAVDERFGPASGYPGETVVTLRCVEK